jgi:hypothetical protein
MDRVVLLHGFQLHGIKHDKMCGFPCKAKTEHCTGAPVAGVACDEDLVIAQGFVINDCEAVCTDNKGLYGFKSELVGGGPDGKTFPAFFCGQWGQDTGMVSQFWEEDEDVSNQA